MIIILFVFFAFFINSVYYFSVTNSVQECINYCIENSERGATSFSRIGDGRYIEDYAYFIAADGDSTKPQEIFVFKKRFFGFMALDRYEFVMSSTQGGHIGEGENDFGSIQFFTKNNKGEKETGSTLLFFGAIKDSDITGYEYTLTVREGSNVYSGNVVKEESVWFVKFCDLGNVSENSKKLVSEVKFYDSEGNIVGIY